MEKHEGRFQRRHLKSIQNLLRSSLVKPHLVSHYVILACPESFFFQKDSRHEGMTIKDISYDSVVRGLKSSTEIKKTICEVDTLSYQRRFLSAQNLLSMFDIIPYLVFKAESIRKRSLISHPIYKIDS
jgi:hypothetical protein